MNRREKDILLAIANRGYRGQRDLAAACGCSLGAVNAGLQHLLQEACVDEQMRLTPKADTLLRQAAPRRAVLLAAGWDRAAPLPREEQPRALLTVRGQPLIERLITQLHEVGITDIAVVVGFAKEKFEYLIDACHVRLIVNPHYAKKNNLYSLALAKDRLENSYIVPCDLWCRDNPFRRRELYSWYMVADVLCADSSVRVNRKQELAVVNATGDGNRMIGISYLLAEDAAAVRDRLTRWESDRRYEGSFWEETLYEKDKMRIGPRVVPDGAIAEINTLEDLQVLDGQRHIPLPQVVRILGVAEEEISHITVLKRGATNWTCSFLCRRERYVLRVPDPQRAGWIDRRREAAVYDAIASTTIGDELVYFDPHTGLRIARYLEQTHPCDPTDPQDVRACMGRLRQFHQAHLTVGHTFDLFAAIQHLESLWGGAPSAYADYRHTKEAVFSLRDYIEKQPREWCLTHMDAVPDNFLLPDSGDPAAIRLIDWEYAAMQDPHLDIAMFALYALFDRPQVEALIDAYFPEGCPTPVRRKIYCYIAAGGLLWSNWCEYKRQSGVEFGAYSLRQYRYAKEYYRLVEDDIKEI